MKSSVTDADDAVQFRLRVNQKGSWQAWDRTVNSNYQQGPSDNEEKIYAVIFNPNVMDIDDGAAVFAFDIMSFDPTDDVTSWLYLQSITLEEVIITP